METEVSIMSNEDKVRAEFEAWYKDNYLHQIASEIEGYSLCRFEVAPFQYINEIPHHDFCVWRSSRALLCVELPPTVNAYDTCVALQLDSDDEIGTETMHMINGAISVCRAAIESQGIRTK
jgi:hypothetical protein